ELSTLRDELERSSRGPVAERLYERPAVVRLARLLTQALRLLPGRCGPRALVEQGRHTLGALLGGGCELAGAVGRHVSHREDPGRRAGLAEPLVVLAQVVDEIACRPDVDRALTICVPGRVLGPGNRDQGRQRPLDRPR